MLANTEARAEITPLVQHFLTAPDGKVGFTAACFGGIDKEWSLAPLQEPGDTVRNPKLTQKIRSAMRHLGADRIYAPSPVEFNGKIIQPADLTKVMTLGHGVLLFRNAGMPADGTFLRSSRDAGIFSAAGCGMIVATLGGHAIFAHAGRECLINRKRVLEDGSARTFESVVDSTVDAFLQIHDDRSRLQQLHAWVLYSIKPEDFLHRYDDPKHAEYNRRVGPYLDELRLSWGYIKTAKGVELDIPAIAQIQFMAHGVPEENIHMEHRYLADELPTTRKGGGRYLVAVVRH